MTAALASSYDGGYGYGYAPYYGGYGGYGYGYAPYRYGYGYDGYGYGSPYYYGRH